MNLLDDKTNQTTEFRTRDWAEINDESRGTYNVTNKIKFKTSMIRSNLSNYSDANIHVKRNYNSCKHWNSSSSK